MVKIVQVWTFQTRWSEISVMVDLELMYTKRKKKTLAMLLLLLLCRDFLLQSVLSIGMSYLYHKGHFIHSIAVLSARRQYRRLIKNLTVNCFRQFLRLFCVWWDLLLSPCKYPPPPLLNKRRTHGQIIFIVCVCF